jgi:hypothetical protein
MEVVMSSLDRRARPRVACSTLIYDVTGERAIPCRATNISEAGVYLRRLEGGVLLEGETVQLELRLAEDQPPIWVAGRVVEQVEEVMHDAAAVQFLAVPEADRARIRSFVDGRRRARLREALAGLSGAAAG